jgi:uncharacterized protein (TIGR02147 family)
VNHAHLSLILRGQRPVTQKFVRSAAEALGLRPAEVNRFLHHLKRKASQFGKDSFSMNESGLRFLEQDQFEVIAEWYHDAILELARLKNFRNDHRWISTRLGITAAQASDATQRLQRLGLLAFNKEGKAATDFQDTTTNIFPNSTSVALRKQQKQILDKSLTALDDLPRTVRDHSSLTLAISTRDIEKAKSLIADFRLRFMQLLQQDRSDYDEVYQLSIGFFPITRFETHGIRPSGLRESGKSEVQAIHLNQENL